MRSWFLTLVQLLLIVVLLGMNRGMAAAGPAGWGIQIVAAGYALWAMLVMGKHLRTLPQPAEGAQLLTRGPFRYTRNPMYSGILLYFAAGLTGWHDGFTIILVVSLTVVVIVKSLHEEKIVAAAFPDYAEYRRKSWRLVPFLW